LEWVDITTNPPTTIPIDSADIRTNTDGSLTLALQGRRYMLRARSGNGTQSRPEPIPGYGTVVLTLVAPPPQVAVERTQRCPEPSIHCVLLCQPVFVAWTRCQGCRGEATYRGNWGGCCGGCRECDLCGGDDLLETRLADDSLTPAVGEAELHLSVPENALVFINGKQTTSSGVDRRYVSQGLIYDVDYRYVVRVRSEQGGKIVEDVKELILHATESRNVAFDFRAASGPEVAVAH
jgi:uncharacterized protein (TIGR03000 family)